jgi:hypothetical protein
MSKLFLFKFLFSNIVENIKEVKQNLSSLL